MNVIGLNFSDSSVEAVEIKRGWFGQASITAVARALLPSGIIDDGKIHDKSKLSEIINDMFNKSEPIAMTGNAIALAIPESQVYTRIVTFDGPLSHDDIRKQLLKKLSGYIPFNIEDVVHDFIPLYESEEIVEVLVAAVPQEIVQEYVSLGEKLNKNIKAIELESVSSARAILQDEAKNKSVLVLDIGARTTIVSFFSDHRLRFTYNIAVAGNHFTGYIMKNLNVTESEAEQLKYKGFNSVKADTKVAELLEASLNPVIEQLQESIRYYEDHSHQESVQEVILIGGSAQLPGIDEFIGKKLALKCVRGSILPNYKKASIFDMISKDELLYINAIGLAMGASQNSSNIPAINFLP